MNPSCRVMVEDLDLVIHHDGRGRPCAQLVRAVALPDHLAVEGPLVAVPGARGHAYVIVAYCIDCVRVREAGEEHVDPLAAIHAGEIARRFHEGWIVSVIAFHGARQETIVGERDRFGSRIGAVRLQEGAGTSGRRPLRPCDRFRRASRRGIASRQGKAGEYRSRYGFSLALGSTSSGAGTLLRLVGACVPGLKPPKA